MKSKPSLSGDAAEQPLDRTVRARSWAGVSILALASVLQSGCLAVIAMNEIECAAGGGDGYRVSRSEVSLQYCDDYYLQGLVGCTVSDADPATFKPLGKANGRFWAVDSRHVFSNCAVLEGARPTRFRKPRRIGSSQYSRAGEHILLRSKTVLLDADAASFDAPSENYGRDRTSVWFNETVLPDADPATFQVVLDEGTWQFGKDINHVYRRSEVIEHAQAQEFSVLVHNRTTLALFLADGFSVYDSSGSVLRGSDPDSFRDLPGSPYSLDRAQVYHGNQPLEGADVATFTPLSKKLAKDQLAVWYGGRRVVGANPDTFKFLGEIPISFRNTVPFYVDGSDTYLFGEPLGTGPASSIAVLDGSEFPSIYFAVDDRVAYCRVWSVGNEACCNLLGDVRASEVSLVQQGYLAGPKAAYYLGRRVQRADGGSFEVTDHIASKELPLARDSQSYYWMEHAVPPEKLPPSQDPGVLGAVPDEADGSVYLYRRIYNQDPTVGSSTTELIRVTPQPKCDQPKHG